MKAVGPEVSSRGQHQSIAQLRRARYSRYRADRREWKQEFLVDPIKDHEEKKQGARAEAEGYETPVIQRQRELASDCRNYRMHQQTLVKSQITPHGFMRDVMTVNWERGHV
mgnify:CR=1 FL=1